MWKVQRHTRRVRQCYSKTIDSIKNKIVTLDNFMAVILQEAKGKNTSFPLSLSQTGSNIFFKVKCWSFFILIIIFHEHKKLLCWISCFKRKKMCVLEVPAKFVDSLMTHKYKLLFLFLNSRIL